MCTGRNYSGRRGYSQCTLVRPQGHTGDIRRAIRSAGCRSRLLVWLILKDRVQPSFIAGVGRWHTTQSYLGSGCGEAASACSPPQRSPPMLVKTRQYMYKPESYGRQSYRDAIGCAPLTCSIRSSIARLCEKTRTFTPPCKLHTAIIWRILQGGVTCWLMECAG